MEEQKTVNKKKPGGRPAVKLEKKRSKRLGYSVTLEQYEEINQRAHALRMTVSDYSLQMVLKGKVVDLYNEEEKEARRKLIGMSNNLNQLTVLAHLGGYQSIEKRVEELVDTINDLLNKS
jgi:hypothetical protein